MNVCVCVCVCACLRPWEGWLGKPKLAPPMPQSLSEMKDDGKAEPSREGGHSTVSPMRTNKHPTVTQRLWYMIQPHLLAFFCHKICTLISPLQRERHEETKSEVLILRKSCIQLLLTQVTHSKQIGEFKIKQLTSASCVCSVCACVCVCMCVCVLSTSHKQNTYKETRLNNKLKWSLQTSNERKAVVFILILPSAYWQKLLQVVIYWRCEVSGGIFHRFHPANTWLFLSC